MGRYRLTPGRRRSILKAQSVSARKRRSRPKGLISRFVLKKAANVASLGGYGKADDFFSGIKKKERRKRRAKRRRG